MDIELADGSFSADVELVKIIDTALPDPFVFEEEKEELVINHYYCPACEVSWDDTWSCACDDECPSCGVAYTPETSEDN